MKRLALLLLLVMAAPAHAAVPPVQKYLDIGHRAFPAACSPVTVTRDPFTAEWQDSFDALAYPEQCRISLPTRREVDRWTPRHMCGVIVHEVGHLAGITEHSSNPRSIMYERDTYRSKWCRRFPLTTRRGVIAG